MKYRVGKEQSHINVYINDLLRLLLCSADKDLGTGVVLMERTVSLLWIGLFER